MIWVNIILFVAGGRSKIISSKLVMVTILRILQFMMVANNMNAIVYAVLQILLYFW